MIDINKIKPRTMQAWAADKSTEIRGAVSNVLGSRRILRRFPDDGKARERLEINWAVYERLKAAQTSEE